jgi:hypothetical protein
MDMTFKTALKRRDSAYKKYLKAQKEADKAKQKVKELESKCNSLQRWGDTFEMHFPISINFSGYEE